MPNTKDLKVRIASIKNTQKITQAMKLVAASKVRKVQQRVLNSRPYTEQIEIFVFRLVGSLLDKQEFPLFHKRETKSVCLLVISSDRGLCGSYNTNIMKRTIQRIKELKEQNITTKLILIGNKANNFFRRLKIEVLDSFYQIPAIPTVELANLISSSAKKAFLEKKVDRVEIIGTKFISMLRSEIYDVNYLPVSPVKSEEIAQQNGNAEVLFEPSMIEVLNYLLPLHLNNVIFHTLLEAACSELSSRMNAMSNATNNAREIINALSIVYNKARQASITQEIMEVVSGAEALK